MCYSREIVSGCVRIEVSVFYTVRTSAASRCAYVPCGGRAGIADWQFSLYLAFDKFPPYDSNFVDAPDVVPSTCFSKWQAEPNQRQSWKLPADYIFGLFCIFLIYQWLTNFFQLILIMFIELGCVCWNLVQKFSSVKLVPLKIENPMIIITIRLVVHRRLVVIRIFCM